MVSTNSITQGEQVAILWKNLMLDFGIIINFAYLPFVWNSEAKDKAKVHCVIIGFSKNNWIEKKIFDTTGQVNKVEFINGYLLGAKSVFIESRATPIEDVFEMGIGNKPIDGGNYLFNEEEMHSFIEIEPSSRKYFKKWFGAQEFINRKNRFCLWLGEATPSELRSMPNVLKRIEAVRNYRLSSPSEGTRKIAEKPTRFHVENMPRGNYLLVPRVSSENRRYIPMGFMTPNDLASDAVQIVPNASLYDFGVLTSNVHMAWMRTVAGRLKSDYRYSAKIVYNNFPWPKVTEEQREFISKTAQAILDARSLYPESTLADLYDELTMPGELRKAHQENDIAVMKAYGMIKKVGGKDKFMTESETVSKLFELYEELMGE